MQQRIVEHIIDETVSQSEKKRTAAAWSPNMWNYVVLRDACPLPPHPSNDPLSIVQNPQFTTHTPPRTTHHANHKLTDLRSVGRTGASAATARVSTQVWSRRRNGTRSKSGTAVSARSRRSCEEHCRKCLQRMRLRRTCTRRSP